MTENRAYSSDAFNRLPFRDQLDVLYTVSARERRDLILSSPDALRLVRSFAAESFFYTLKDLGLQDSTELLELASGEQLAALVDLDCWKKDRVDVSTVLDWLEMFVEAGPQAMGEFLNSVDLELLIFFLKRFVQVYRTDDPEEPPEVDGAEIFELDEHYQIVFPEWNTRTPLVRRLIESLHERDYSYFVTVMEEVWWGVESDLEEASFRLRNARMQDRGFPDYIEAQQIFRPITGDLPLRTEPIGRANGVATQAGALPADRALLPDDEGRSFLSQVLNRGFAGEAMSELRFEMAHLSNRVLVAEGVDYADRDQVAEKIHLAHDTVNLALESLAESDLDRGIRVLERHYVQHLFRVGWTVLLDLRRHAKRALESLGVGGADTEVVFLDTPYREALAGVLRPKPRFFGGLDQPGEIAYRSFASLEDLERARTVVGDVASLPRLCERLLGQSLAQLSGLRPSQADDFRLSAAILTAFSQLALGRPASVLPIEASELRRLRQVTADPGTGRLREDLRGRAIEAAGAAAGYLDFALRRFEEEFLSVSSETALDPRFVTCLMIHSA